MPIYSTATGKEVKQTGIFETATGKRVGDVKAQETSSERRKREKAERKAERKKAEKSRLAQIAADIKRKAQEAARKVAEATKKAVQKAKELAAKLLRDKAAKESERIRKIQEAAAKAKEIIKKAATKKELITPAFETKTDLVQEIPEVKIMTEPYITEIQIDTYKGVPITETVHIDPTVIGKQEERPATQEEIKFYEEQKKQAVFDEVALVGSFPNTEKGRADAAKAIKDATTRQAKKDFIAPIKELAETRIITEEQEEKIEEAIKKVLPEGKAAEFIVGAVTGIIPKTKGAVAVDVATFGIGVGLGAGVRLAEKGVGLAVGKIAPIITKDVIKVSKAVKVTTGAFKGTTTIAGTVLGGAYVVGMGKQISVAETPEEKGEIFGKGAKELVLFGAGYAKGTKVTGDWLGSLKAKEYTTLPTERLVVEDVITGKKMFPEAGKPSVKKHFDIFTGQEHALPIEKLKGYTGKGELIYPETFKKLPFEVKPGGYHATDIPFWIAGKEVKVIPGKPRGREMVGLDIAESISVHFLRAGKGKYKIPTIKEIFTPSGEGAILRVIPTEFVKGRGGKLGKAYVTGKKPEVQSTIPVETVGDVIKGKYALVWEGVKRPIDIFITKPGKKVSVKGKPKTYGEIISSYEYAPLPSYPKVSIKGPIISSVPKVTPSYISKITPGIPSVSVVSIITPSVSSVPYISKVTPSISKISIIPSKVSYTPSPIISKPSYVSIISKVTPSVSKVSYVPKLSYTTSYAPSYKPSVSKVSYVQKPSYAPSYTTRKPSYAPSSRPYKSSYPYPPIIIPRPSAPIRKKVRKKVVIKPGKGYEGFYKRFGKWKTLVKGTRAQAVAKVKRKVSLELGASYKVKDLSTGKYIFPEITKQFRRSRAKKTPYIVVEKRKYRLDSPKEKGEIKYAKKVKGGINTMAKRKAGRPKKKKVTRKKKR